MQYYFWAEPRAIVRFDDEQWELLLKCFKLHYDYKIQSAVELGGWLYGLNNQRKFSPNTEIMCELTDRQIDSMCKALEMGQVETYAIRKILTGMLYSIHLALVKQFTELNKELQTKKFNT